MDSNINLSNDYNNNCSNYDLVGLAASLAILISKQVDAEDLAILATFITCIGDNLALLASTK